MLDVKRLRVLKEVAAKGSFSAAAESLSYTQSAVSQQIAALEREAGTTLVERGARGVRLTAAGEALTDHTDAILARLRAAERDLEAIAGLRGGQLRVFAFPSAASSLVPPAIAEFRRLHPAVDLSLAPAEPLDAIAALKAGECDVAITLEANFGPSLDSDDLDRRHLLDDQMYVVLPRDHRLAGRAKLKLADLASEAWILGATDTCPDTAILLRACQRAGFEPTIAFHSDDYSAIQGFIAAGVGVALIPDLALVSVRDDIVIRAISGDVPIRRVFAVTLAGCNRAPAGRAMVDILETVGQAWQKCPEAVALTA